MFRVFTSYRQRSKYEICGADMTQVLEEMRQNNDERVYWYQIDAVLETNQLIRAHPEVVVPVLIVAPAGSGKTGMAVLLPYVLMSRKVLIITPSKVIGKQLGSAFGNEGFQKCFFRIAQLANNEEMAMDMLEPVMIVRNSNDLDNPRLPNLVIVNAQNFGGWNNESLMYGNEVMINNVRECFAQFDTLIVDEAHHYPAETWRRLVDEFGTTVRGKNKKIVFLTATPHRVENGVNVNILANQQVAYTVPQIVQGSTIRLGTFREVGDQDEERLSRDICDIFNEQKTVEPRHQFPQAMILVRTKAEAEQLAVKLNADVNIENFAVPIFTGDVGKENLQRFNEQRHQVAVTCVLLLEGYNTNVSVCVILRNGQSQIVFNEFIGRCMRKHRFVDGEPDRTVGVVVSYEKYGQKTLWDDRDREVLGEGDPAVDDADVDIL